MNNAPISAAQLGEGLMNAGSALAAAGNSLEQSLAILTAANATTQDISKASTAVRTISARIQNSSTTLEELGETMEAEYDTVAKYRAKLKALTGVDILQSDQKSFRATYDILKDIAAIWKELDGIDRASVTGMLAGVRQTNVFQALMNGWDEAETAMELAENASGSLADAQTIYIDSIQGRLEKLSATFQEFSQSAMSSGLFKALISGGTGVLEILTQITDALGALPVLMGLASGLLSGKTNKGIIDMPCPAPTGAAA